MKNFILLLVITTISSPIFSQEKKAPPLKPPYFSILTSIGGLSAVGGGTPRHTTPTIWTTLEGIIPVNHPKIYLYTQLRFAFPMATTTFPFSSILPIINMENFRIGALFGFGGVLEDWRNKDGKGWHITMNTGLIVEGKLYNNNNNIKTSNTYNNNIKCFINLGLNLNIRFRYNISTYSGITLGFNMEYLNGIYAGDPFYIGKPLLKTSSHMIGYGIAMGLHF